MAFHRGLGALVGVCVLFGGVAGIATARETASACEAKCELTYRDEAATCGKKSDDGERLRCQKSAHERYRSCRGACPKSDDDVEACKERCHQQNERDRAKCAKLPDGPRKGKCVQVAQERWANCLGDCERRR